MWQGVPFNSNMADGLPHRDVNRNFIVPNTSEIEHTKNDDLARRSGGENHENDETKIINVEEGKETKVRLVCSKSDVSFTMSLKLVILTTKLTEICFSPIFFHFNDFSRFDVLHVDNSPKIEFKKSVILNNINQFSLLTHESKTESQVFG